MDREFNFFLPHARASQIVRRMAGTIYFIAVIQPSYCVPGRWVAICWMPRLWRRDKNFVGKILKFIHFDGGEFVDSWDFIWTCGFTRWINGIWLLASIGIGIRLRFGSFIAFCLLLELRNMLDGICHATVPHQRSGSGAQGRGVTNGRPGNWLMHYPQPNSAKSAAESNKGKLSWLLLRIFFRNLSDLS